MTQVITPANAKERMEESIKSMREGYVQDSAPEDELPEKSLPPEPSKEGEPGETFQGQDTRSQQPTLPSQPLRLSSRGDLQTRYTKLEQDHRALEARFKSVQAAITPIQQERSELRKQVTALEIRV